MMRNVPRANIKSESILIVTYKIIDREIIIRRIKLQILILGWIKEQSGNLEKT
jgi:hypothetical protein